MGRILTDFDSYFDDGEYDEWLEDEVCPRCDAELDDPGRPCPYCEWDPLDPEY